MAFLGFGDGGDGGTALSGAATEIDSACTGTAAATSLSATNASFTAGQKIFIIQYRGTGVGQYEENVISSYVAGTITTSFPLAYTYVSGAQVKVMREYTNQTIASTYTCKPWNGTVGGIIAFYCNGTTAVNSSMNAVGLDGGDNGTPGSGGAGAGYRGGNGATNGSSGTPIQAFSGEGTTGASAAQFSAVGSGGGGGRTNSQPGSAPGGGGGHATAGAGGGGGLGSDYNLGVAGGSSGSVALTTMTPGGGGGGGAVTDSSTKGAGGGGGGGGIIYINSRIITGTGTISVNGGAGGTSEKAATGGDGAGGSIFLRGVKVILTNLTVTAAGGSGGGGSGASGASGRIHIEGCQIIGATTPTADESEGGQNYCTLKHAIL